MVSIQFPVGSVAATRCERLRAMYTAPGFRVDRDYFISIDAWERLAGIIGDDTPWSRMFEACGERVYRSITLEFCSSFTCSGLEEDAAPDAERRVAFRLGGDWRDLTLEEFAIATGFYTTPELQSDMYTDGIWRLERPTLVSFWDYLTDHRHHFGRSSGPISQVRDPLYRVVHHMIARSIVPRERSRDKANQSDLFHLFCILTGRACNLAASLALYFEGVFHRQQRGAIYGGGFVTAIARNLHIDLVHLEEGEEPDTFGKANLQPMGILHQFLPNQWRLVSDPLDQVPFVPEPNPEADQIPEYREARHGVPDLQFVQPQPRHPPHPIIGQPEAPQPPLQQPQQPPQHPHHVYDDMTPGARAHAVRTDRRLALMEQRLDWLITTQVAVVRHLRIPDVPPPPADDGAGPSHPPADDDA